MLPNEIIGLAGYAAVMTALPMLLWHGYPPLMFLQLVVGAVVQTVFLSYWGLTKFNGRFTKEG